MFNNWKKKRKELNALKELQNNLDRAEEESRKAYSKVADLLVRKNTLKILEAESKDGLSILWDEFHKDTKRSGRLNGIWEIKDRQFSTSNGRFYMSIEYVCFALVNEKYLPEYLNALEEFEMLEKRCENLKLEKRLYYVTIG
ncbi:hypothetical protein A8L34_27745 [Bacillus sp. FJAT-27264]|uniref:hypothetical protein n=1 Tax=Paenibacillus sp. (strain DSM 101736 / FJAT-27264) TaxID=1850362 RepID=UPI000807B34E|nr:hypothetical protein [Bacillus sp. FJAT-27264]OBZ15845.1 hypothetical protein A8L34_27745 [Bacillus sp. FJAT-27264]